MGNLRLARIEGYHRSDGKGNRDLPVDGMSGAHEEPDVEAGDRMVRLALADQIGVLGGIGVALRNPEGEVELGADLMAGALVVGVGVGEGVRRQAVVV